MMSKRRACCEIVEKEAEFEVVNFAKVIKIPGDTSSKYWRWVESGHLITVGDFQFGLGLSVRKMDEFLELEQPMDVYLYRVDEFDGNVDFDWQFVLLNRDPSKNSEPLKDRDQGFMTLSNDCSCLCIGDNDITLANILNNDEGWLHDSCLRISVKIFVSLGFKEESFAIPVVKMEKEVCDCFASLLESKEFADVELIVGEERFEAHSLILMARLPIFRAMLTSPMREGTQKRVVIEDCEAEAVKNLLKFLYTGLVDPEVLVDDNSTLALLRAAHRYEACSLIEPCARALQGRLTVDTVSDRLSTADLMGCSVFKSSCLEFMCEHMRDVKKSPSYLRLAKQNLPLMVDIVDALTEPPQKRARR